MNGERLICGLGSIRGPGALSSSRPDRICDCPIEWRNKAVPASRYGLNEAWIFSRVAQRFANLIDGRIQVVVDIDEGVWPEPVLQFIPGDYLARLLEKYGEYLKGLAAQLELHPTLA